MLNRALVLLAGLVVVKVTLSVVLGYRDYFPPDFGSDFLRGREAYFFGSYGLAFYTHVAAGPVSLVLGLILVGQPFPERFPKWHRRLGKAQIALVLGLIAPSGLWMAIHAEGGVVAALGFASLAIATGLCAVLGWRSAVQKRFAEHGRWMSRCFLLLCAAVVIRLIGGAATTAAVHAQWMYPLAAWMSWMVPLAVYEVWAAVNSMQRDRRGVSQSLTSSRSLSSPAMEISARR